MPPLEVGPVVACLGGAAGCAYALSQIARAAIAVRWPTVEGEIAGTRLVHRFDGDGSSTDYNYVSYRYQVDGRPYRNDRVRFGPAVAPSSIIPTVDPPPNNPWATADLARRFRSGAPVRVFYNPGDPSDSALHAEASAGVWIILAAGAVFAYVGARALF